MAKFFDYISVTVITFLLTFVWTALVFDGALPALIMSCTLTLIAVITFRYIRLKLGKPYTYDRLALEFGIRGNEYIVSLLKSVIKNPDIRTGANFILLERSIIISNFRFSSLGIGDVGAAATLAKKYDRRKIFLVAKSVDRRAYTVAQLEGVKLDLVRVKTIYTLLKKHGALPDLKLVKEKFSLKGALQIALSRANFKSYAFSGVLLTLVSFITPLKIYYITVGSLSLLLALLTLTPLGNGNFSSPKLTAEFENAVTSTPNQISIEELEEK